MGSGYRTAGRNAPGTRAGAPAEPARTSPVTASRSALRTAAAQSPWRLRSAGFPDVDLPIFHTARIDYPTGRAGLGFHTPRIGDAGRAIGPYVLPFRRLSGSNRVLRLLDRVDALENRGQATGIASVFLARFSGEPSRAAQGSLENRRFGPAVLWRTVRFPDTSARPGRNTASRPGRNAPVSGREPAAFSSKTWPGEPGMQRILRSGFLEMTAEDSAIAASATTLEPNSRRSVTDPPCFRIGDKPEADPYRSRSDPSRPVRLRPQRPLIGSFRRWRAARRQGGYRTVGAA